jgi:hypothetical protein
MGIQLERTMTVDEQLYQLAEKLAQTEFQEGEVIISPDEGQDAESFQADVRRLREYAALGYFRIRNEKRESTSANRNVVRVQIRMGPEGVAWRKSLR